MKHIHIVSFDVPYPTNYGGVIDVFHRCKALTDFGYEVTLHCFEYGRGKQEELKKVAKNVFYYKRKPAFFSLFSALPMIVYTRQNKGLLNNLIKDNSPIIFEGEHTTAYLNHPQLKGRIQLVRSHNVEHDYYRELSKLEPNLYKKLFFLYEAKKLRKHENLLQYADKNLTVSHKDNAYYQKLQNNAYFLPVANPLFWSKEKRETSNYVLMHGNLAVQENDHAVRWVISKLKTLYDFKLVVAGKEPSKDLQHFVSFSDNTDLIVSPSNEALNKLIRNAGVNLLITFQNTGIKHKLINAISNGGHVLVNPDMVDGTGLSHFCDVAEKPEDLIQKIKDLLATPFPEELNKQRIDFLEKTYGLENHAKQIDEIISGVK